MENNVAQQNQKLLKITVQVLLFLSIVAFIIYWWNTRHQYESVNNIQVAMTDTLRKSESTNEYYKIQLQSTTKELLRFKELNDKNLLRIQELLAADKSIQQAVIAKTETIHDTTYLTDVTVEQFPDDTSGIYKNRIYTTKWNDRWSTGSIIAYPDSIKFSHKITNIYEVSQSYKKINGAMQPVVTWRNLNPYTSVDSLNSWILSKPKVKRFVVAGSVGYGFGYGFKPQTFVGVTLGYKLFEF